MKIIYIVFKINIISLNRDLIVMRISILTSCLIIFLSPSITSIANNESRIEVLERQLSILASKVENLNDISDLKSASVPIEKASEEEAYHENSDAETRISNIEDTIQALINKIENLEKKMEDNEKLLDSVTSKFYNLTQRLSEIETKLDKHKAKESTQ